MAASRPNKDDGEWIIYKGDMPIDDFLKRNPPTQIECSQYSWISVWRHSDFSKMKSPDKASLLKEWKCNMETSGKITSDYILQLAEEYDYKTGKWLIYSKWPAIDNVWKRVAKAVVAGKLGCSAKVSTHDPEEKTHVICVYTEDFTNEDHVRKVEQNLRKEGITERMTYKPDIYTTLGIYRKNPWGLRPTVYSSHP